MWEDSNLSNGLNCYACESLCLCFSMLFQCFVCAFLFIQKWWNTCSKPRKRTCFHSWAESGARKQNGKRWKIVFGNKLCSNVEKFKTVSWVRDFVEFGSEFWAVEEKILVSVNWDKKYEELKKKIVIKYNLLGNYVLFYMH